MTRTETGYTEPDDLAPGVYVDADGDLWAVDREGTAHVLTDVNGAAHDLGPLLLRADEMGGGMPADQAHDVYTLHLRIAL